MIRVDTGHDAGVREVSSTLTIVGADVLEYEPEEQPYAVLAAPPCTTFCRPGARWWKDMDARGDTERDKRVFLRCLELCKRATGWWALENPPGRHMRLMPEIGQPSWQFHPYEYGDPWKKQTYIWGTAVKPPVDPVEPLPTMRTPNGKTQGRIARLSSSHKREREKTPQGFARAFFKVNR